MKEITQYESLRPGLEALLAEMEELSQPRSCFALRHFVVGQHDLPARQRQQALLELREMLFSLADQVDEIRLLNLDVEDELRKEKNATGNNAERARIKAGQLRRRIEGQRIQLSGRLRECEYLFGLIRSMPKATAEELESQELEYWSRRLTRQYTLGQRDVGGNLNAMLEMLTDPGQPKPEMDIRIENLLGIIGLGENAVKKLMELEE